MASFHNDFLSGAEHRARFQGLGFSDRVCRRIDEAAVEYGTSYREKSLDKLLHELYEEGLDVGGWSALIAEVLPDRNLEEDRQGRVQALLLEAAAHGVVIDQIVSAIREELA
jgi:hypothetical protein